MIVVVSMGLAAVGWGCGGDAPPSGTGLDMAVARDFALPGVDGYCFGQCPADLTMGPDLSPPPDLMPVPDLSQVDLMQPAQPDLSQPDLSQPIDFAQPDLTRPDLAMPDLAQPDLTQPDLSQPDLSQPDLSRPDLTPPADLLPPTGTQSNPGTSCKDILTAGASNGDGPYYLKMAGTGATYQTRCDMTRDGGGWTLVGRARKTNKTGWGTTGTLNLGTLFDLTATDSSKISDVGINGIIGAGYRVDYCSNTRYFKPACVYAHNTDAAGACNQSYTNAAFSAGFTQGVQNGGYQALNEYTDAARGTTALIVHDPVGGVGADGWWTGGVIVCDMNVWVK